MSVDIQAIVIPVVVLGLILVVTRWMSRPPRARVVDAADLDVIAAGISLAEAMELRAALGAADIETSMTLRGEGDMEVWVFRSDLDAARTVLNG